MGNYTELIFGAALKEDTSKIVIDSLLYMLSEGDRPEEFPLFDGRCEWLFIGGSYYFGVNEPVSRMWKDQIDNQWKISTRSNIKNYENEIETFLEWIKPYIDQGSGIRNMYAIVIYEEGDPQIYYLDEE